MLHLSCAQLCAQQHQFILLLHDISASDRYNRLTEEHLRELCDLQAAQGSVQLGAMLIQAYANQQSPILSPAFGHTEAPLRGNLYQRAQIKRDNDVRRRVYEARRDEYVQQVFAYLHRSKTDLHTDLYGSLATAQQICLSEKRCDDRITLLVLSDLLDDPPQGPRPPQVFEFPPHVDVVIIGYPKVPPAEVFGSSRVQVYPSMELYLR